MIHQTLPSGGFFGADVIAHFNGGLFADDAVLALSAADLETLERACRLDWHSIEPAIFGTLFERSLDPAKRSQLGAHYTSREDIGLIVEPVLMAPLRRRWAEVQAQADELVAALEKMAQRDRLMQRGGIGRGPARRRTETELQRLLVEFAGEIAAVRVLDPACGSGNFLYVALKQLLDLEKEVVTYAARSGVGAFFPRVEPGQLYGIELDPYAHELAQVAVWIGYIQWLRDNGFGVPSDPILKPLENIRQMDAILAFDEGGRPYEPEWPEADVIIGNPPFLGDKKMRAELGHTHVEDLRRLYWGRVPGGADLVTYWFERARALIESRRVQRAGLLATNSIRGGANRQVLDRIRQSGGIFMGWSDRPWVLEGAAVRVSMIGFDSGAELTRTLDGVPVTAINPDLTGALDLTLAKRLPENAHLAFIGDSKKGKFDVSASEAERMLSEPLNPNGKSNRDVLSPWANGVDVTERFHGRWIVDFGIAMPESDAALYAEPYEYVRRHVKPARDQVRNSLERSRWWLHARPAPDLRQALSNCQRYIATSNVAKYRLFVWFRSEILPSHSLTVVVRDDDYFFGVLHAKPHELWALRMGTALEDRPRYTPTTTFETYPFPWPPGTEPQDDPRMKAIADAARKLVEKRDRWLNPEGASETELKKRTLTNLYNERPTWLALAHEKLDRAVLDAYGWPHDLSDEELLERLLALNLERASVAKEAESQNAGSGDDRLAQSLPT